MTGNGIPGVNKALMQKAWSWGGLVRLVVPLVTCPGPSHFHHVSCMLVKPGCTRWWRKTTRKQTFFCQQKQNSFSTLTFLASSPLERTVLLADQGYFQSLAMERLSTFGGFLYSTVWPVSISISQNCQLPCLCYSPLGLASLPFSYLKSLINLSLITMPPSKGRIRQDSKTMND